MDRNNILAFALSMLVFAGYLMYQEHRRAEVSAFEETAAPVVAEQTAQAEGAGRSGAGTGPVETTPAGTAGVEQSGGSEGKPEAEALPAVTRPTVPAREVPLEVHTLENGDVVATISNDPAMIQHWALVHYDERLPNAAVPIDLVVDPAQPVLTTAVEGIPDGFGHARFEVVHAGPREIVQQAVSEAGVFMRTLRLDALGYGFDLELAFDSRLPTAVDARFELGWPARTSSRADFREVSLLAYGGGEGVTRSPSTRSARAGSSASVRRPTARIASRAARSSPASTSPTSPAC